MFFSKSFSYAIRAIIYLARKENEKMRVQLDEIAESLAIPRFFLAKVMNRLVKEGLLTSVKGHGGGFCINDQTMGLTLGRLLESMGEMLPMQNCLLQLGACDAAHPCAVHHRVAPLRAEWLALLNAITIRDLLEDSENETVRKLLTIA